MITKQSIFLRKFRSLILRTLYTIENDNDCNFETNGEKVFINNLFKYFSKSHDEQVVLFDVGANIGEYSELLIAKSDSLKQKQITIHAFEPTQACFEVLQKKFLNNSNVLLNKLAVSNNLSTAEIFYDQQKSGLASLYKRNISTEMNFSEIVNTIRLDTYLEQKKINHIHFLKIDIEGHELVALEGLGDYLNREFIDFIQFEYGGTNLDSHTSLLDLYTLLEKSNFTLAKVRPKGLEIRPYQPWMENFQYANYVAISNKIVGSLT